MCVRACVCVCVLSMERLGPLCVVLTADFAPYFSNYKCLKFVKSMEPVEWNSVYNVSNEAEMAISHFVCLAHLLAFR